MPISSFQNTSTTPRCRAWLPFWGGKGKRQGGRRSLGRGNRRDGRQQARSNRAEDQASGARAWGGNKGPLCSWQARRLVSNDGRPKLTHRSQPEDGNCYFAGTVAFQPISQPVSCKQGSKAHRYRAERAPHRPCGAIEAVAGRREEKQKRKERKKKKHTACATDSLACVTSMKSLRIFLCAVADGILVVGRAGGQRTGRPWTMEDAGWVT